MSFNANEGLRRIALLLTWIGHICVTSGFFGVIARPSEWLVVIAFGAFVAGIFYCTAWVIRGFIKPQ